MTTPQIGNYGVTATDHESGTPKVSGFVIRDQSPMASNWRSQGTLKRLPDVAQHRGHRRCRYAGADAQAALGRRDARRHRDRRGRAAGAGGARARRAAHGGRRPRQGRDLRRGLRLRRCRWPTPSRQRASPLRPTARRRGPSRWPPTTTASRRTSCAAWWRTAARCACSRPPRRRPTCSPGARRRLPQQRSRRPGGGRLRDREREDADGGQPADLRHLPRPSAAGARPRRHYLQAQVRAPRRATIR